jgi:hypothetical protein
LLCDAPFVAVTHGVDGEVVGVSARQRLVRGARRRLIELRDGSCRVATRSTSASSPSCSTTSNERDTPWGAPANRSAPSRPRRTPHYSGWVDDDAVRPAPPEVTAKAEIRQQGRRPESAAARHGGRTRAVSSDRLGAAVAPRVAPTLGSPAQWPASIGVTRIRRRPQQAYDVAPRVRAIQRSAPDGAHVIRRVDAAGATTLSGLGVTITQLKTASEAIDKGKLTKAGRAAHKHSVRSGSLFGPELKGKDPEKNAIGKGHVDEILDSNASTVEHHKQGRYGMVIDVQIPGGKGVRFTEAGEMIGFLEP